MSIFYPKSREEKKTSVLSEIRNVDTLIQLIHETNPGPKRSDREKQQSKQIIMYFLNLSIIRPRRILTNLAPLSNLSLAPLPILRNL